MACNGPVFREHLLFVHSQPINLIFVGPALQKSNDQVGSDEGLASLVIAFSPKLLMLRLEHSRIGCNSCSDKGQHRCKHQNSRDRLDI
ncbi:hypothetical protein D3C76_1361800 [compost metagenome]